MQKKIEYKGTTDTIAGWARRMGMSASTLRLHISKLGEQEALERNMPAENKFVDDLGEEYTQKPFSLHGKAKGLEKGERIRVYNRLRTRLHCSDCVLEAEAEGSILAADYDAHESIRRNVIKVAA